MIAKKKCSQKNCNNLSISFSNKCGEHISKKELLNTLNSKHKFNKILLSLVDLKSLQLANKTFTGCEFQEIEFEAIVFESCSFIDIYSSNVNFRNCSFIKCLFKNCDLHNNEFENSSFSESMFVSTSFMECSLYEQTSFLKSDFTDGIFMGTHFHEVQANTEVKFIGTKFYQSVIDSCGFKNVVWTDCTLNGTSLHDTDFSKSIWINIYHDFAIFGSPKLCIFLKSSFEGTEFTPFMKKWNLFRGKKEKFYLKIVDMIAENKHPNFLSELTIALERLKELGFVINIYFANKIIKIFRRQFEIAAQEADYRTIGRIITEYGCIPNEYKISGFALPAPQKVKTVTQLFETCLYVQLEFSEWTVKNIHKLYAYLNKLSEVLPESNAPIVVYDILQGSMFQTFWGDFKQLFVTGRLLDIEKMEVEVENSLLDIELKKMELKKNQENLKSQRVKNEIRIKKSSLEIEDLELSILQKKLDILNTLQQKFDFNFSEYSKTKNGVKAINIVADLKNDFPVMSLKLKILEQKKK